MKYTAQKVVEALLGDVPGGSPAGDRHDRRGFDPAEMAMGIKVEMEHTDDRNVAEEIALDHLTEDPHYYSKLQQSGLANELGDAPPSALEKEVISLLGDLQADQSKCGLNQKTLNKLRKAVGEVFRQRGQGD